MLAFAFVELLLVKGISFTHTRQFVFTVSLVLVAFACGGIAVRAQNLVQADADNVQQRIGRARALAAVGNLPAARSELESLTRAQGDESVREIALVLLVRVYLEQADYAYAEGLLNETFAARQTQREAATHAYFALSGQVINAVRTHVERYRAFGLDVTDGTLPPEAASDLDHLRTLIERIVTQGKQLRDESGQALETSALIEEAAGLRVRLARNTGERTQWQREVTDARQRLAGSNARLTVSNVPPNTRAQTDANNAPAVSPVPVTPNPTPTPAVTPSVVGAPAPATTTTTTGAGTTNAPPTNTATPQPDASNHPAAPDATKPSAPAQPLQVGATLITKAKERIAPSYPPQARTARVTGSVTVFMTVDEKGEVAEVQRTSGPELLRRAAEDAARHWKFRPTVVNGQPVRVAGYISFNFAL